MSSRAAQESRQEKAEPWEAGAFEGWQPPVLALAGSACGTAAIAFCPAGEQLPPGFNFPNWCTRSFAKHAALPQGV